MAQLIRPPAPTGDPIGQRIRVVLAPDKFKSTLTAAEVAAHLVCGVHATCPDAEIVTVPVADGGEGTLTAFCAAGFARVQITASDAVGRTHPTAYARRGQTAVIELAEITGLARLGDRRAPLTATSRGLGEAIAAALDAGCDELILGLGGSASTDGGAGMITALGARILNEHGAGITPDGGSLLAVRTLDLTGLHPRLASARITVGCDVDSPLTGLDGAAAVYAPQKGAGPDEVRVLDAGLRNWADVVAASTGAEHRDDPGAGAAGGVGFAAIAVLGATMRSGVEVILDRIGFAGTIAGADLVITGEGALDAQTLRGKAPAGVAVAARAAGAPVIAVAGRCRLRRTQWQAAGFADVLTLRETARYPGEEFDHPGAVLCRVGERIGARLAATPGAPGWITPKDM